MRQGCAGFGGRTGPSWGCGGAARLQLRRVEQGAGMPPRTGKQPIIRNRICQTYFPLNFMAGWSVPAAALAVGTGRSTSRQRRTRFFVIEMNQRQTHGREKIRLGVLLSVH
ncbi:hypothetical protein SEVIR_3G138201v4 [Setaria viridis]|uniref:Uncharacterized protein n=1 Tax=Setaria viridis TaxID=4556 RepID=A0A4U6V8W0_SETVI|nr:hypothetical protein SEVIR_3G138201v2 [Setaria viridis]